MAKLIVVTREQVEASHRKLEELLAKDPLWQEEKKQMEDLIAVEKARRDAEFAAIREEPVEGQEGKE